MDDKGDKTESDSATGLIREKEEKILGVSKVIELGKAIAQAKSDLEGLEKKETPGKKVMVRALNSVMRNLENQRDTLVASLGFRPDDDFDAVLKQFEKDKVEPTFSQLAIVLEENKYIGAPLFFEGGKVDFIFPEMIKAVLLKIENARTEGKEEKGIMEELKADSNFKLLIMLALQHEKKEHLTPKEAQEQKSALEEEIVRTAAEKRTLLGKNNAYDQFFSCKMECDLSESAIYDALSKMARSNSQEKKAALLEEAISSIYKRDAAEREMNGILTASLSKEEFAKMKELMRQEKVLLNVLAPRNALTNLQEEERMLRKIEKLAGIRSEYVSLVETVDEYYKLEAEIKSTESANQSIIAKINAQVEKAEQQKEGHENAVLHLREELKIRGKTIDVLMGEVGELSKQRSSIRDIARCLSGKAMEFMELAEKQAETEHSLAWNEEVRDELNATIAGLAHELVALGSETEALTAQLAEMLKLEEVRSALAKVEETRKSMRSLESELLGSPETDIQQGVKEPDAEKKAQSQIAEPAQIAEPGGVPKQEKEEAPVEKPAEIVEKVEEKMPAAEKMREAQKVEETEAPPKPANEAEDEKKRKILELKHQRFKCDQLWNNVFNGKKIDALYEIHLKLAKEEKFIAQVERIFGQDIYDIDLRRLDKIIAYWQDLQIISSALLESTLPEAIEELKAAHEKGGLNGTEQGYIAFRAMLLDNMNSYKDLLGKAAELHNDPEVKESLAQLADLLAQDKLLAQEIVKLGETDGWSTPTNFPKEVIEMIEPLAGDTVATKLERMSNGIRKREEGRAALLDGIAQLDGKMTILLEKELIDINLNRQHIHNFRLIYESAERVIQERNADLSNVDLFIDQITDIKKNIAESIEICESEIQNISSKGHLSKFDKSEVRKHREQIANLERELQHLEQIIIELKEYEETGTLGKKAGTHITKYLETFTHHIEECEKKIAEEMEKPEVAEALHKLSGLQGLRNGLASDLMKYGEFADPSPISVDAVLRAAADYSEMKEKGHEYIMEEPLLPKTHKKANVLVKAAVGFSLAVLLGALGFFGYAAYNMVREDRKLPAVKRTVPKPFPMLPQPKAGPEEKKQKPVEVEQKKEEVPPTKLRKEKKPKGTEEKKKTPSQKKKPKAPPSEPRIKPFSLESKSDAVPDRGSETKLARDSLGLGVNTPNYKDIKRLATSATSKQRIFGMA